MSLGDLFEDSWDFIVDGTEYFISMEWIQDAWEGVGDFFSAMFEGIGEFSFLGLTFAILAVLASYGTRYLNFGVVEGSTKQITLIASMTQYMPPAQRIFWTIASYAAALIGGYFVGKYFENT